MREYESIVMFEPDLFGEWANTTVAFMSSDALFSVLQERRVDAFRRSFDPGLILERAGLLPNGSALWNEPSDDDDDDSSSPPSPRDV
eukprot:2050968-Prymnesium_polylepis.2